MGGEGVKKDEKCRDVLNERFLKSLSLPRDRSRLFSSSSPSQQGGDSPPPLSCGPAITHSSQLDFLQFSELFRSFLVRSRKDLRTLFEQVASRGIVDETPVIEDKPVVSSKRVLGERICLVVLRTTKMKRNEHETLFNFVSITFILLSGSCRLDEGLILQSLILL